MRNNRHRYEKEQKARWSAKKKKIPVLSSGGHPRSPPIHRLRNPKSNYPFILSELNSGKSFKILNLFLNKSYRRLSVGGVNNKEGAWFRRWLRFRTPLSTYATSAAGLGAVAAALIYRDLFRIYRFLLLMTRMRREIEGLRVLASRRRRTLRLLNSL